MHPHSHPTMATPFLSLVEQRWNARRRAPSSVPARSHATRPSPAELLIEVETTEARATIAASEHPRTLHIVVHRFKNDQVVFDGPCTTDAALDRGLDALCTDLSASPFAQ